FLFALPVIAAAAALTILWPEGTVFLGKLRGAGLAFGIALAAVGIVFWAAAAVSLIPAYREDRLAARGAYGLSRHPIYAWWIFFILPPAAFILNSWAFLAAALGFYLIVRPAMKKEDDYLAVRYGLDYVEYQERVRQLLPVPKFAPFTLRRYIRGAAGLVLVFAVTLASYFILIRPVILGFGATRAEQTEPMPGDQYITEPRSLYTQAAVIDAPPEAVWSWLVQIGYKRAGWYNLDGINKIADRDYFYEGNRSATRIIPELQDLKEGDIIYLVPQMGMTVTELRKNELLVMAGNPSDPDAEMNAVWVYKLLPWNGGQTRLIVRFRSTFPGGFVAALLNGMVNEIGGAMIQQPAMMTGLKRRAEL
ncbi:MAG: hypothetical protein ACLFST_15765, partial [Spirochaetia bacterium]